MTGQEVGVLVLVGGAVLYLVRKVGFAGRRKSPKPKGPDVPLSRLTKPKR